MTSLNEMASELRSAFARCHPAELDDLDGVLAPFCSPGTVCSLVQDLLADTPALAEVARRSYAHVNGFDKIVLLSSREPEFDLRLHLWWPEEPESALWGGHFRTHNHRWDFCSYLIAGNLHFRFFEESEEPDDPELYAYQYFSPERDDHFEMRYLGRARLKCLFESRIRAGTRYCLSHQVQHTISSDRSRLGATILLRGPTRKTNTRVYVGSKITKPDYIPVRRLAEDELRGRLERLLDHV